MIGERIVYSVSDVNRYIKAIISQDENLKFIYIKGEISNFKGGANGHLYFSLKDKDSLINVAMFNTYASKIAFVPKNGDEVVLLASVDVYPPRGAYQLLAYEMNQVGQGAILVELEKLKKALQTEGLFDVSRKREINIYPSAIGVITAKNSAAIKDILTNIKRRYPIADIYVFYASVQGENASKELLKAFNESQKNDLDTLIIGRGGGASEDLSAFNDETLVRAIANSKMPVIAAVGHEIDSTLVDFVADKRASTPTGAAELATVDRREIEQRLEYAISDMKEALSSRLEDMREKVNDASLLLSDTIKEKIEYYNSLVDFKKKQLETLNPKNVLSRGYSLTMNEEGKVVTSINDVKVNNSVTIVLQDGQLTSKVERIQKDHEKE